MPLPDLNNLLQEIGPRCMCGEPIEYRTWRDEAANRNVICLRVHGRQFNSVVDEYEMLSRFDFPAGLLSQIVRNAERVLQKDCPSRQATTFGEVIESGYEMIEYQMPDGSIQRRMGKLVSRKTQQVPTVGSAARPSAHPNFGKPTARKILS
jgi:hypothetical protein